MQAPTRFIDAGRRPSEQGNEATTRAETKHPQAISGDGLSMRYELGRLALDALESVGPSNAQLLSTVQPHSRNLAGTQAGFQQNAFLHLTHGPRIGDWGTVAMSYQG